MDRKKRIKVVYEDGTGSCSIKIGILLEKDNDFIEIDCDGQIISIPIHRVVRIEDLGGGGLK